jgi:hypothetical protein
MKRFVVSLMLFILMGLSVSADSLRAPRGWTGSMYKSTLALYGTKGGVTRFLCTAEPFEKIAGGYRLISAGHCVQLVPMDVQFSVAESIGGPLTPVKVLKAYLGDGYDFSEFELKTDRKYSLFILGDEHDSRVGDSVVNPNFAVGFGKQLSLGAVSSDILLVSSSCPIDECAGSFLVQTYGAGGSSGSAVLSVKTRQVIGLITWSYGRGNVGFGVQPISTFYKFLVGPSQPHPDSEEAKAAAAAKVLIIPVAVFQQLFGEDHPFTLGVHGPNPVFTISGYTFQIDTDGLELSDEYYYNVPVFLVIAPDGYRLTSTKEGVSVVAVVVAKP